MKKKMNVKPSGEIKITVFKDVDTNYPFFYIQPDSEKLLPIVDVLEEVLKCY